MLGVEYFQVSKVRENMPFKKTGKTTTIGIIDPKGEKPKEVKTSSPNISPKEEPEKNERK